MQPTKSAGNTCAQVIVISDWLNENGANGARFYKQSMIREYCIAKLSLHKDEN